MFADSCDPEEYLSEDEMMIPFKGRSSIKQHITGKPYPWGIKFWVLAGISGYVYAFEIYQGVNAECQEFCKEFGAVGGIVLGFCKLIMHKCI